MEPEAAALNNTVKTVPIAILGAGPAGLGAAWKLCQRPAFEVTVVERGPAVGGNAGSFSFNGMRVDYGSHRLHPSCDPAILGDIRAMLGADLLDRPRHGRIRLRGKWVHFPLQAKDLALHLPPSFMAGVGFDALAKAVRRSPADTFAGVLEAGLGKTICRDFYFPYARKIWGVEPEVLDAEQARRRVSAGSLAKMARKVLNSLPGIGRKQGSRFYYPRHGYGAISEAYSSGAELRGAAVRLRTSVSAVEACGGRVVAIRAEGPDGEWRRETAQVLSSIPVTQLVRSIRPAAPREIAEALDGLSYRAMILIYMALETEQFTEFDAHYFPGPEIAVTRLSEPKNYGLAGVPGRTVLCAELPCSTADPVWRASDAELEKLMLTALANAGLPVRCRVLETASRRLAQAYPIYFRGYSRHFARADEWLGEMEGLVSFGRQGLFAHDNTHHALAMAYALDRCMREDGSFDRELWTKCRLEFQRHVVED